MRAASGVEFLVSQCQKLTLGNSYPNTLAVLSAAILKLGKISSACKVYRAPGGALPTSFWVRDKKSGVQGGLELAFMSTTTHKEEAMKYARRSPGMILFEIQQERSSTHRTLTLHLIAYRTSHMHTCTHAHMHTCTYHTSHIAHRTSYITPPPPFDPPHPSILLTLLLLPPYPLTPQYPPQPSSSHP